MSLDHMPGSSSWNLLAENHAQAPVNDWDVVAMTSGGECHDPAHATWESAWIDIGGEG